MILRRTALIAAIAVAFTLVTSTSATAGIGQVRAADTSGCGKSGCGYLHITYVYRTGATAVWQYVSENEWLTDMRNGVARGVKGKSGYTSIWVTDTANGAEANAHFTCTTANRECSIKSAKVNDGINMSYDYYLDNLKNNCKDVQEFYARQAQALTYWLYWVGETYANKLAAAEIYTPSHNLVSEKSPNGRCS